MIEKPAYLGIKNASAFQHTSVAKAYRHRPPYPAEIFNILVGLVNETQGQRGEKGSGRVLDIGCGTGDIARQLVGRVAWVDAADISQEMIEQGKLLPNGNHPHLHWIAERAEDVELDPSYDLIVAGESLHWMDWNVVLPRFQHLLTEAGYLAIVRRDTQPAFWFILGEILDTYKTDKSYQPYDMISAFEQANLFQTVGDITTTPVPFVQQLDDFIESYHSRSGFARERMGPETAAAFDQAARAHLLAMFPDEMVKLQVAGHIVWGIPLEPGTKPSF